MKSKKILAGCLAAGLVLLTGCQLAREDAGNAGGDRLIGVFVTTERLDLSNETHFRQISVPCVESGETIAMDWENRSQGRLYATLKSKEKTGIEAGNAIEDKEFVFEGVEGIPYFAPMVIEDGESRVLSEPHEAVSDHHITVLCGDEEEGTELVGTLYLSPNLTDQVYYLNRVYQDAENRVYLSPSYGGYMVNGKQSEGQVFSFNTSEATTVTEGWKIQKVSFSVEMALSVLFPSEKIVALQLDADSNVLLRTEYVPGQLPDALVPLANTEFVLVETHKRDAENRAVISRAIYGLNDTAIETFYCRTDGISVKQFTQLEWTKK